MSLGQITAQANNVVQPLITMCQAQGVLATGGAPVMKANLTELQTALQAIVTALTTQIATL
jgi:hydroxyethylthiazole kinase-like sugar kinase family protein